MARRRFGADLTAVVWRTITVDDVPGVLQLAPGTTVTAWTAETGGTQITDLTDPTGVPQTSLTADTLGGLDFFGPDTAPETVSMWLDTGAGDRQLIAASDLPLQVLSLAADVVNLIGSTSAASAAAALAASSAAVALDAARAGLILLDTFRRPDAPTLGTADTGQAWAVPAGSWSVSEGRAVSAVGGTAGVNVGRANVDARCLVTATSGAPGLAVAMSADGDNRLNLQIEPNTTTPAASKVKLQKTDGGTTSPLLPDVTTTLLVGTAYELRLLLVGASLRGYLDGAQVFEHTLSNAERDKYALLTRVGFRNTGAAAFDDLSVRLPYPAAGGTGNVTRENLPAGDVFTVEQVSGAYTRGTARDDLTAIFVGSVNPGPFALEGDFWAQTP